MIFRSIQVKNLFHKTSDVYNINTNNWESKESKIEPDLVNITFGIGGNCGKGKGCIKKGNNIEDIDIWLNNSIKRHPKND